MGALAGQSCLLRHCTQVDAWQNGVAIGQSVSAAHTTQWPPALQIGVGAAHCALERHCTQDDVVVLQWGSVAGQLESAVHPGRQVNWSGSQMGAAVPQSALERHCTHLPPSTRQRGAFAGQSVFAWHCTH